MSLEERVRIDRQRCKINFRKRNVCCIEFMNPEEKLQAMRAKKNLRGTDIWLDDDLIKREVEIKNG